jgi:uncharacterized protein (DUF58 family)
VREALSALTTRGRAFLAAGCTVTLCALLLGFDALMRVGVLAVALPLLAAFVVSRARYRFGAGRRLSPQRVSPGQQSTVTLSLANGGAMPMGLLLLEDHVPYALGTRARFVLDQAGPRWHEDVQYTIRSEIRGRYEVGPLSIRVSDPFGFIELVRTFSETSPLMVVPAVHTLPAIRLNGEWTGQGENRPRAFAVGSAEDVTTREYRRGDDLRRVHWRSTARTGDLMVRREEQPWQSRATVVLDSRRVAHRGSGAASSLEWLVTAAASVAVHLTHAGFSVRLVTDRPLSDASSWHDRRPDDAEQSGPILDELAVMAVSNSPTLVHAVDAVTASPGLVVALLAAETTADLGDLARMRSHGSTVLGIVLDTSAWGDEPDDTLPGAERLSLHLANRGWCATTADPYESPAAPWGRLGALLLHGAGRGRSA